MSCKDKVMVYGLVAFMVLATFGALISYLLYK